MNILLKQTGVADTELGREISKYLFWFEMAALSGELSVALHGKIQASASKILAKETDINQQITKFNTIILQNVCLIFVICVYLYSLF